MENLPELTFLLLNICQLIGIQSQTQHVQKSKTKRTYFRRLISADVGDPDGRSEGRASREEISKKNYRFSAI